MKFWSIHFSKFREFAVLMPALLATPSIAAAHQRSSSRVAGPLAIAYLDDGSSKFFESRKQLAEAKECLPIHVDQVGQVATFFQYCSPAAVAADSRGVELSQNIVVPDELAQRFHFWRRVYSLWSIEQYVLHVTSYPEVVLEVADTTRVDAAIGEKHRDKLANTILSTRRRDYRRILVAMHKTRDSDHSLWTPTMRRIEESMNHIVDANKYAIAARSQRIQRGQREFIARGIEMSSRYLPAIEKEFESQGVPLELSRIAFVESSFNLAAQSHVGASGVYQLMAETARPWLRVTEHIDERNDPIKAGRMAARVLKQYYTITGSWPLAITAYNHGVNGIKRAVRATGSNDLATVIRKYRGKAFGFASRNFYTEYCAVLATLQHSREIFPEVQILPPLAFKALRLTKPTAISEVKKKQHMSSEQVAYLNRDISRPLIHSNGLLPVGYVIKVPTDRPQTSPPTPAFTLTRFRPSR